MRQSSGRRCQEIRQRRDLTAPLVVRSSRISGKPRSDARRANGAHDRARRCVVMETTAPGRPAIPHIGASERPRRLRRLPVPGVVSSIVVAIFRCRDLPGGGRRRLGGFHLTRRLSRPRISTNSATGPRLPPLYSTNHRGLGSDMPSPSAHHAESSPFRNRWADRPSPRQRRVPAQRKKDRDPLRPGRDRGRPGADGPPWPRQGPRAVPDHHGGLPNRKSAEAPGGLKDAAPKP